MPTRSPGNPSEFTPGEEDVCVCLWCVCVCENVPAHSPGNPSVFTPGKEAVCAYVCGVCVCVCMSVCECAHTLAWEPLGVHARLGS